jgi:hypothetical protein
MKEGMGKGRKREKAKGGGLKGGMRFAFPPYGLLFG